MKKVFSLLLVATLFAACGEADTAVYDGSSANQTLIGFDADIYDLPVKVNETGTLNIEVQSTTKSNVDRVFNITRIDEESNANPAVYDLPATVTIPAGEFIGILTIVGTDVDLSTNQELTIQISSSDSEVIYDNDKALINIAEVCPIVRDEFIGSYTATETPGPYTYPSQVTAGTGPNDLIISNVWEADANSKTKVTIAGEFNNVLIMPAYLDNYLFDHPTYGAAYIDANFAGNPASTIDACTKTITLNFRVRVSAGTFAPNKVVLVKN